MAKFELRLTCDDFEKDNSPEILLEYFTKVKVPTEDGMSTKDEVIFAMYASSSKMDGYYDTTSSPADMDNDGDLDEEDKALYLTLANTFAKICLPA